MDLDRIQALIELMTASGLSELEVEDRDGRVRLCRETAPARVPVVSSAQPLVSDTPQSAEPVVEGTVIRSPMVGTFYRSPRPGAPPFIEVGDAVRRGQVLCIIEAMKLMNELESEVDGVVAEIRSENAQPVQFGQALFRIVTG